MTFESASPVARKRGCVQKPSPGAGVPVILAPLTNLPTQFDRLGARFDNATLLRNAGVEVVISSLDTHNSRNLRYEAGNAVRHGMSHADALHSITMAPARAMGIDDTRGSIEPGRGRQYRRLVWRPVRVR